MKIFFWGTRGSLPSSITSGAIKEKIHKILEASESQKFSSKEQINVWIDNSLPFWVGNTYGTNTPCVQIADTEGCYIFCDAGTGIRDFAFEYSKRPALGSATFHIFISHLHWDHIMGFPFFSPAFDENNRIVIHGYHEETERAFHHLMKEPYFPIDFKSLKATIEFDIKSPGSSFDCEGFLVKGFEQAHPGISYGYRFEKDGKSIVYSTDSEHKDEAYEESYTFHSFIKNADVLIFDAMYTWAESVSHRENWGHSSNIMGVELSSRAKVKQLVLFHHEPTKGDRELDQLLSDTLKYCAIHHGVQEENAYPEKISLAYDGMKIEI